MKIIQLAQLVACGAFLALCGCATDQPLPEGNGAYAVDKGYEYKLGPGDKVRLTVFGEEQLSGEFLVGNDGGIAVPLVGEVRAGGLSPVAFQGAVETKLTETGMVKSPRVSADIVSYRPFYILGEVNKPGQYPYVIGMTLTKAVATAGGFTYRANGQLVYVTREGETKETALSMTAATWIGPGDTLRVGERMF